MTVLFSLTWTANGHSCNAQAWQLGNCAIRIKTTVCLHLQCPATAAPPTPAAAALADDDGDYDGDVDHRLVLLGVGSIEKRRRNWRRRQQAEAEKGLLHPTEKRHYGERLAIMNARVLPFYSEGRNYYFGRTFVSACRPSHVVDALAPAPPR